MTPIGNLQTDELVSHCVEEIEKFNRRQPTDPRYCFELLRRALIEGSADDFTHFYHLYEKQVIRWVYSHSRFHQTGENAEYFVCAAFSKFYFALRGAKFAHFPALPQVLAYLKLCVHTAIIQFLRDQAPPVTSSLEEAYTLYHTPNLEERAIANELWEHICRLLPNKREQKLAYYALVLDLKPRHIVSMAPQEWGNERAVTVALHRIRRTLRNNTGLQTQRSCNA